MKEQKKVSWAAPCSGNTTVSFTAGAQEAAVVPLQFFRLLCSNELPNTLTLSCKTYISQTCVFFLRSRFICRYADILYVWVSDGWCVCVASLGFYCGEAHHILQSSWEEAFVFFFEDHLSSSKERVSVAWIYCVCCSFCSSSVLPFKHTT